MKRIICFFLALFAAIIQLGAQNYEYRTIENIPYAKSDDTYAQERCKLDLYYPVNAKGFKTLVWFHGGGLTGGSKFIPEQFKNSGFALIAVNYRLLPKASLDNCIEDAAAAVAWAFENIAKYGGDSEKIYVTGHSAGGYLTSMIGLDRKWLAAYGVDADDVVAYLPLSGHAISHFAYRQAKGMATTQPSIDEYAPLYYVREDASPFIIICGDRELEMLGRYEENAYLWRMLKVNGHKSTELYELDGYDHGAMADPAFVLVRKYMREGKIR